MKYVSVIQKLQRAPQERSGLAAVTEVKPPVMQVLVLCSHPLSVV